MQKDQLYGWLIFLISIAAIVVYIWTMFTPYDIWVLKLTGTAAIVFGFGIMAWIGYTLATTPPPEPIEIPETELKAETPETPPTPPKEPEK